MKNFVSLGLQAVLLLLVAVEVVWQACVPAQRQYIIHNVQALSSAGLDRREPVLLLWALGWSSPLPPLAVESVAPELPDPVPSLTPSSIPVSPELTADEPAEAARVEAVSRVMCQLPMPAAKVEQKSQQVYRWTDAQGQVHFGDRPQGGSEDLSKRYERQQRQFQLKVDYPGWDGYPPMATALENEARLMYRIITDLIPARQHRAMQLNVNLYPDWNSFATQLRAHNLDRNTGAFYSSAEHRMYIPFDRRRGLDNAMDYTRSLARHEMTHAITTAMLGSLPMWLNEGLAEYMERLDWQMNAALVHPGRFSKAQHKNGVSVTRLTGMDRGQFYASQSKGMNYLRAAAFVHFLMGHDAGRRWLGRLLEGYADAPCHRFVPEVALASYEGGAVVLEQAFNQWLARGQFATHQY